jgi:hypothetical protein
MDRLEEVAEIETALAALLATIDRQHTKLATIDQQRDSQTSSPLEDLLEDPVGQSCRLGISRLDARLHELDQGRTQIMSDVKGRVCKNNDGWAEIIDKRWHEIGD